VGNMPLDESRLGDGQARAEVGANSQLFGRDYQVVRPTSPYLSDMRRETSRASNGGKEMGLRFYRRVPMGNGTTLNLGKRNISMSFGGRGFHYTIGTAGRRVTIGLPGTGLYWTEKLNKKPRTVADKQVQENTNNIIGGLIILGVIGAIFGWIGVVVIGGLVILGLIASKVRKAEVKGSEHELNVTLAKIETDKQNVLKAIENLKSQSPTKDDIAKMIEEVEKWCSLPYEAVKTAKQDVLRALEELRADALEEVVTAENVVAIMTAELKKLSKLPVLTHEEQAKFRIYANDMYYHLECAKNTRDEEAIAFHRQQANELAQVSLREMREVIKRTSARG